MPMMTSTQPAGAVMSVTAATPGWKVDAYAPRGTDTSGVPAPLQVVAWALIADDAEPGGSVLEPVFVAGERCWTPEQFRAAYGETITLKVVAA